MFWHVAPEFTSRARSFSATALCIEHFADRPHMCKCRLHCWLPHMTALTSLTMALAFPCSWPKLLPVSLQALDISNVSPLYACPWFVLQLCTNLTKLSLQCISSVDDNFLKPLSVLSNLQKLFLCQSSVTGHAFRSLTLPKLHTFALGPSLDGTHLQDLSKAMPALQTLRLDSCGRVRQQE